MINSGVMGVDVKREDEGPVLEQSDQLFFDFSKEQDTQEWPKQERFPVNRHRLDSSVTVEQIIIEDIKATARLAKDRPEANDSAAPRAAEQYLIITGFTSLASIVRLIGRLPHKETPPIHIVLGNEPTPLDRAQITTGSKPFQKEIRDYWLSQGISIVLNGRLLTVIQRIQEGRLTFSESRNLHAKIYLGRSHAVLGSSNFSRSGLVLQKEANIRFPGTQKRYAEIQQIAHNFKEKSSDCTALIEELLRRLLQQVTWKEALARAVAELLEGGWVELYPSFLKEAQNPALWPSQRQAIAQALYILDNQGSVLIADPTGSGKTRVGVNLLYSVINRKWKSALYRLPSAVVIAPPLIQDICWRKEGGEGFESAIHLISSGILSTKRSDVYRRAIEKLRNCSILLIDEAHNFLNFASARSKTIAYNTADNVILSTATPINRTVSDIFRLVEILGLDNLSRDVLEIYYKHKNRNQFSDDELVRLREQIKNFTVRRTKSELNRMIETNPENYINRLGSECRYPHHISKIYETGETDRDREIANRIDEVAAGLKGLLFLRTITVTSWYGETTNPDLFVERSLKAARSLALYNIRSMLRSSRGALVEHIEGTDRALEFIGIPAGKLSLQKSGNVCHTLRNHAERLPQLPADSSERQPLRFPEWLTNPDLYRRACEEEVTLYERIAELAKSMSPSRELKKAETINSLTGGHPLIVVYDNRIITLHYISKLFDDFKNGVDNYVVTGGSSKTAKRKISELFDLSSSGERAVAFCSDAMAEGVNFQAASAVVFLDIPTVIRLAEQRVGRVDRLDSPHKEIEVYWPDDGVEFALRTDRRFVERHYMVSRVLGANMKIPQEFLSNYQEERLKAEELIRLYQEQEQEEVNWDGIEDAFQPVRDLVFGDNPLITPSDYRLFTTTKMSVQSVVGCLDSPSQWAFFALKGSENRAPQWLLVDEHSKLVTDLGSICRFLSLRLPDSKTAEWSNSIDDYLVRALAAVKRGEHRALPNKRRRALKQIKTVCIEYLNATREELQEAVPKPYGAPLDRDSVCPNPGPFDERREEIVERREVLHDILAVLNDTEGAYDLYWMASRWLEVTKPSSIAFQEEEQRRSAVRIKQLTPYLIRNPISTESLATLLDPAIRRKPLEQRIAACIIAVPEQAS